MPKFNEDRFRIFSHEEYDEISRELIKKYSNKEMIEALFYMNLDNNLDRVYE